MAAVDAVMNAAQPASVQSLVDALYPTVKWMKISAQNSGETNPDMSELRHRMRAYTVRWVT